MTKMPQMHIQRSLRVTPYKQTCADSLLLTWDITCGSPEFFCSIQLCIHMLVKGFYRQPACLLLCVCACCLSGSAEPSALGRCCGLAPGVGHHSKSRALGCLPC